MATNTKPVCHIHDKVERHMADDIRAKVCVNDRSLTEFEGRHYCLFHLPAPEKDAVTFEEIFRARLPADDEEMASINRFAEERDEIVRRRPRYDFRFVWFPIDIDFANKVFSSTVDFSWATFSSTANFTSATFTSEAHFGLATFLSDCSFRSATFSSNVVFDSASFSAETHFNKAVFSSTANFWHVTFSKTSETSFHGAKFAGDVYFNKARFENDVSFNGAVFGDDSDVFFDATFFNRYVDFRWATSQGYLRFSQLGQGSENTFDFQEAAFHKATMIGFHTMRLHPNWFVNVDARKFVFTDILWENLYWNWQARNKNVDRELKLLDERGIIEQKKRLFEIAARQLAVNAEENNRYDEAARFRYMAMETRRLEDKRYFRASRLLFWLYKWTSGYGESWSWAVFVLIAIWFAFGVLYWQLGSFADAKVETLSHALGFSTSTMLFQKTDIQTRSDLTFTLRALQIIVSPLQAALLALAIRRKFMR